jgi:MYXO-CTERM domain-containing protein
MKQLFLQALAGCSLLAATPLYAQTTITAWTFDNDGLGVNSSPAPATGSGTATALGFTTSLTTPPSISAPDIINSVPGSSTPATPDTWRLRGNGASPNNGNGWTTNAAIGTQGARFTASTDGFSDIQISFDVAPTTKGTANLQLEYTTDGVTWNNATLSYSANPSLVKNNSTSPNTVLGSYLSMIGAAAWYNDVTANLSGVAGANNDPNFAIEIVNASTGADDLAANDVLVGTTGNWSLDNVVISGIAPVPEPATLALGALGLAAIPFLRRQRKS